MNPAAGDLFPGSLLWSVVGSLWVWLLAVLLGATILPLRRRLSTESAGTGDAHRDGAEAQEESSTPPVGRLLTWAVLGIMVESYAWFLLTLPGWLGKGPIIMVAFVLTVAGAAAGAVWA